MAFSVFSVSARDTATKKLRQLDASMASLIENELVDVFARCAYCGTEDRRGREDCRNCGAPLSASPAAELRCVWNGHIEEPV